MSRTPNFNINHIALSVPDIDAACRFYESVFGFRKLKPNAHYDRSEMPDGIIFKIYGVELQEINIAYLSAGNGIGWELFEFIEPRYEGRASSSTKDNKPFPYTLGGYYHIAVTVHDLEDTLIKFIAAGGKHIGEAVCVFHDKATYVQDPWGNIIELLTCSFKTLLANR